MRTYLLAAVMVIAACDDGPTDEVVGNSCDRNSDCAERCFLDPAVPSDFPGGFCSLSCQSDLDCPGNTACVDKEGGMCLFVCPAYDCEILGAGWFCDSKDHVSGGSVNVCIGD